MARLDEEFVVLATERLADPRPIYAHLRKRAPVFRTPFEFWYVTSYEIGNRVSRADRDWTVASAAVVSHPHPKSFAFDVMGRMVLTTDGPTHARLRRLVGPVFNPRGAEALRDKVRRSIELQLAELPDDGIVELLHDFAILLPTKIVLDVLGLPHSHVDLFVEVADMLIAMHEPTATEATIERADQTFRQAAEVTLRTRRRAARATDQRSAHGSCERGGRRHRNE
jgi:cytochrome P450